MTLDDMSTILARMFDAATTAEMQGWIQEAYRTAVADSKWYTEELTFATTTAGDNTYAIPANVVALRSLFVNGVEYGRVGEFDIDDLNSGGANVVTRENSGVFAQSQNSAGEPQVRLWPTPTSTGLAITGKIEEVAADLVTGSGAGSAPVFPADLHPVVLNGAIAIGYMRSDERPDMAGQHQAAFEDGVRKLRARRIARVSGRGPQRISVQGRDW